MAKENKLPVPQQLTSDRKKKLKSRLKDCGGLDGWNIALEKLSKSDFCKGNNNNNWTADFDFVLKEKSFTKLMEGSYDNRGNNNGEKSKANQKMEQTLRSIANGVQNMTDAGY